MCEHEILAAMRAVAPPGQGLLSDATVRELRSLTGQLITAREGATGEYERFQAITRRGLCLPVEPLTGWLHGATVLVTGGTGCIGSALMTQLARLGPGRLVSVSRGVTGLDQAGVPGASYYLGTDIRDRRRMDKMVRRVRPDVIFHTAAQRNPGLAELDVHRTVTTNILGTRNVLAAADAAGVPQVVCASTGKAMRPYSPEVYTASKRAAEWIAASSGSSMRCSAARFTHVADNSIILNRLHEWAGGGVARLHSADIAFYIQSAAESAQLLLIAGLGAVHGTFRVHAITDLGWPVNLLDLAVGVLTETQSHTPIYISGYDCGYEEVPFPGLYDPATAGDVSPLLNAFEAAVAVPSPCPMVDAFPLVMRPDPAPVKLLAALEETCAVTGEPAVIRGALDDLSWSLLDATLEAVPPQVLARSAALTDPYRHGLSPGHQRMLAAIRRGAGLPHELSPIP